MANRDAKTSIKSTEQSKELWKKAADLAKRTLSDWAAIKLDEAAQKEVFEFEKKVAAREK